MKDFLEKAENVEINITTPDDCYFDFCSKYRTMTGESCIMNEHIKKHGTKSSKWGARIVIKFNSDKELVKSLERVGYKVNKRSKSYMINSVDLFWKIVVSGFRFK